MSSPKFQHLTHILILQAIAEDAEDVKICAFINITINKVHYIHVKIKNILRLMGSKSTTICRIELLHR